MRACVTSRHGRGQEAATLCVSRCSGSRAARPQPRTALLPPKALFIASNILRSAHLGINVPRSSKPSHKSEELVMRYFLDVWNEGDIEAVKELCSEDLHMSDTNLWPDPFCGQDHVVRVIEEYMTAFKLFRYTYVQALGTPDGKEVLAHWSVTCAQLGDLWHRPPTGAVEEIGGMTRFVILNDKISRIDTFRDKLQHEMSNADYTL